MISPSQSSGDTSSGGDAPEGPSLSDGVRALIEDSQTLIEAEVGYQKARIAYGWSRGKGIFLLLLLAFGFGFFALLAVVVGLLLALAPLITPWGSLALVVLILVVAAVVCFTSAVRRFRSARSAILASGSPR